MTASKGLRPALLFLSSGASLTTASISPRKLSKGTSTLSVSSGSPLALIASRRLSRSKKPGCPTAFPSAAVATTRESDLHAARHCYFSRCPFDVARLLARQDANRNGSRLPAAVEHRKKRTADYLAAKEGFIIRKYGCVADCMKLRQRRV